MALKKVLYGLLVVIIIGAASLVCYRLFFSTGLPDGFAAVAGDVVGAEINVSAPITGTVKKLFVDAGGKVYGEQIVAELTTDEIESRLKKINENIAAEEKLLAETGAQEDKGLSEAASEQIRDAKERIKKAGAVLKSFYEKVKMEDREEQQVQEQFYKEREEYEKIRRDRAAPDWQVEAAKTKLEALKKAEREHVSQNRENRGVRNAERSKLMSEVNKAHYALRVLERPELYLPRTSAYRGTSPSQPSGVSPVQPAEYENIAKSRELREKIRQLNASRKQLEKMLQNSTVIAPATGTVLTIQVRTGYKITQQKTILTITSSDEMEVLAQVSEKIADKLKRGTEAKIAFADLPGKVLPAFVSDVGRAASPEAAGKVSAHLRFIRQEPDLKPGMKARVILRTDESADWDSLPQGALEFR